MKKDFALHLFLAHILVLSVQIHASGQVRAENIDWTAKGDSIIITFDLPENNSDELEISLIFREKVDKSFNVAPKSVKGTIGKGHFKGDGRVSWAYKKDAGELPKGEYIFDVNIKDLSAKISVDNSDAPYLEFVKEEYNFGSIRQGQIVYYEFIFINEGGGPLIISEASGSSDSLTPQWPKAPIAVGERSQIRIAFNSEGKIGMQDKTVTINSNATNNPIVLHLRGNVNEE